MFILQGVQFYCEIPIEKSGISIESTPPQFAGFALACVLLTIASIYVGLAVNYGGNDSANFCTVGTRIVRSVWISYSTYSGLSFATFD